MRRLIVGTLVALAVSVAVSIGWAELLPRAASTGVSALSGLVIGATAVYWMVHPRPEPPSEPYSTFDGDCGTGGGWR